MATSVATPTAKRASKGQSFRRRSFYDHSFSNQDLSNADFRGATLMKCNFDNCDLSYADFECANLDGTSFRQTRLYRTNFKDACLARTTMDPRDMMGATLTLHCDTMDQMKASPLWLAAFLQLVLVSDITEEQREKVRGAGEAIIGKERMAGLAKAFGARHL